MENNRALTTVIQNLQIEDAAMEQSGAAQFEVLVAFLDELIRNDFNRLLSILYRVDISEEKLKRTLSDHKGSNIQSAELIAQLMVEREAEKIRSREKYRRK